MCVSLSEGGICCASSMCIMFDGMITHHHVSPGSAVTTLVEPVVPSAADS